MSFLKWNTFSIIITQHRQEVSTLFSRWILRPCLWHTAWWPTFRRARSPPRWPCNPAGQTRDYDRSRRERRSWRCPIRWEAASLQTRGEMRCEISAVLSSDGHKDNRHRTDACRCSSSVFFYFIIFWALITISRIVTFRDRSWISGAIIQLNLQLASRGSFMTV